MCGSVRYRDAETTLPSTCRTVSSELHRASIPVIAQPPYSLDLAPSDFWLFSTLKMCLKGDAFRNHRGHQIECDGRTPEDSKRSLLPVLPTMAGSKEQVCVRARVLL